MNLHILEDMASISFSRSFRSPVSLQINQINKKKVNNYMLLIRINMYVFLFHYLFIQLFIILMNCTTELSALHIFIVDIVCKEELENGQLYVKY